MTHTPEPWRIVKGKNGFFCDNRDAPVQELEVVFVTPDIRADDAARIVACVNGCKGIANPAAVQDLRKACKQLVGDADFQEEEAEEMGWSAVEVMRANIQAARAALAKAEGKEVTS